MGVLCQVLEEVSECSGRMERRDACLPRTVLIAHVCPELHINRARGPQMT